MDERTFAAMHRKWHQQGKTAKPAEPFGLMHKRDHARLDAQALTASLAVGALQAQMRAPEVAQFRARMRSAELAAEVERLRGRMRAPSPSKRASRRPAR